MHQSHQSISSRGLRAQADPVKHTSQSSEDVKAQYMLYQQQYGLPSPRTDSFQGHRTDDPSSSPSRVRPPRIQTNPPPRVSSIQNVLNALGPAHPASPPNSSLGPSRSSSKRKPVPPTSSPARAESLSGSYTSRPFRPASHASRSSSVAPVASKSSSGPTRSASASASASSAPSRAASSVPSRAASTSSSPGGKGHTTSPSHNRSPVQHHHHDYVSDGGDSSTALSVDFKRLLSKPALPTQQSGSSIISIPLDVLESAASSTGTTRSPLDRRSPSRRSPMDGAGLMSDSDWSYRASPSGGVMSDSDRSYTRGGVSRTPSRDRLATGAEGAKKGRLPHAGGERRPSMPSALPSRTAMLSETPASSSKQKMVHCRAATAPSTPAVSPAAPPMDHILQKKPSKTRNVLKRRPSAGVIIGRGTPLSPSVTPATATSPTHAHGSSTSSGLKLDTTARRDEKARLKEEISLREVLSLKDVTQSTRTPKNASLTPAGAIKAMYTEQESRRESIAAFSTKDLDAFRNLSDAPPRRLIPQSMPSPAHSNQSLPLPPHPNHRHRTNSPHSSNSRHHSPAHDPTLAALTQQEAEERTAAPYYTVIGSTTGRVVAVGVPEDASWCSDPYTTADGRSRSQDSRPRSVRSAKKSLTRKISGKWSKVVRPETSPAGGLPFDGRPSLQERRRSFSVTKEGRRSLRVSVDKEREAMPVSPNVDYELGGLRTPGSTKQERFFGSKDPAVPAATVDTPTPDRTAKREGLWSMMKKRISISGLKEHALATDLPPVPALPKDYQRKQSLAVEDMNSPGVLSRFMTRPSMAIEKGSPKSVPSAKVKSRPSTATQSSSPVSSDKASSNLFNRAMSTRSSTSSYGDEIQVHPPMPSLGQHILPPSELYRINQEHETKGTSPQRSKSMAIPRPRTNSTVDGWNINTPLDEIKPTLPHPPVRINTPERHKSSIDRRTPSPSIPAFSTDGAINTFGHSRSLGPNTEKRNHSRPPLAILMPEFEANIHSLAAPPRPSRSSMRPLPSPTRPKAHSELGHQKSDRSQPSTPSVPIIALTPPRSRDTHRKSSGAISTGSASTARPTRRSASQHARGDQLPGIRTPVTFREMRSAGSERLSEKEKADRWDDLLERSAAAGGTLHVGGEVDALESDRTRFSTLSELE